MRTHNTLALAFQTVKRQPARSALTILGLAIGVGAFIAMLSFGEGARRSVLAQFQALGTNLLKVTSATSTRGRAPEVLTDNDIRAIERDATTVETALPVARRSTSIAYASEQRAINVYGTLPRFVSLHSWELISGGPFDRLDVDARAKVCVLGMTPVRNLFGTREALGQTVTLGGVLPCRVIGILGEKGFSTSGADLDDLVLLPVTTFNVFLSEQQGYTYIEVEPLSPALLDAAKGEVTEILRRLHRLGDAENDFTISSPIEVIRAADRTSRILSGLLAGIAGVSLLVGGIGIMNIQLVSVAERTQEIGIRSAIGAAPRQILAQFLSEAAVLAVLGVTIGVSVGIAVASLVASWMAWPRVISLWGVMLSSVFGAGIGIAFGYLPARRAASLDPIVALRHE